MYKNKNKKYFILSLVVALFGEIYFYPFQSELKFSAGVIIFNLIILLIEDISELALAFFCGISIVIIRDISALLFSNGELSEIILFNMPSLFYYLCYGFLLKKVNIKKYKDKMFSVIVFLSLIDSFSNILEAFIRRDINFHLIKIIIIVGFIRSFTAYLVYITYNKQKLYILSKEHQKRYTQLNLVISNIQAEMFYLRKSMKDIEGIMSKSYGLYECYRDDQELKDKTLEIAREIHEVKKDYYRVLKGFECFMNNLEDEDSMTLSNVFTIIKDNTNRYIKENNLNIKISFKFHEDFYVKSYYNLFVIINNLIINSIEACEGKGNINIVQEVHDENILFTVSDTGKGIEKDLLPYIFNAGFTTKYNEETGEASTGIGLSHIKNIIEDLGGIVEVKSEVNIGTSFLLEIPRNSLIGG